MLSGDVEEEATGQGRQPPAEAGTGRERNCPWDPREGSGAPDLAVSPVRLVWDFWPQNCMMMSWWCLKPLHQWPCVTAVEGDRCGRMACLPLLRDTEVLPDSHGRVSRPQDG